MTSATRYEQLIEHIFFAHYIQGGEEVAFEREELERAAQSLGIKLPKNLGDVIYSFRYRTLLPATIRDTAPENKEWIIRPAGQSRYRFVLTALAAILPNMLLARTKVPDSTPGIIARYALNDEQALLAKLRYNRLIDIFTGVTCYSLQNHLRTSVQGIGQVETDEVYIGIDRRGVHYVFPVQAKGGTDKLSIIQIEQDLALCAAKFPGLVCHPIAAQFMDSDLIALFQFEASSDGPVLLAEKHYWLVSSDQITSAELAGYRTHPP